MESLDRPYGDDDEAYRTVEPELTSDRKPDDDRERMPPTVDRDDRVADPAFQAVEEAGGGVAEGFETAEGQLIENIENAPDADRTVDAFDLADPGTDVEEDVEADVEKTLSDKDPGDSVAAPRPPEVLRTGIEYGEPDQEDVTEVVRDPSEEVEHGDDPGAGPGVAFDR